MKGDARGEELALMWVGVQKKMDLGEASVLLLLWRCASVVLEAEIKKQVEWEGVFQREGVEE